MCTVNDLQFKPLDETLSTCDCMNSHSYYKLLNYIDESSLAFRCMAQMDGND